MQVTDAGATHTAITHTGSAPLPTNTNAAALAEGILGVGDAVPDAAFIDQANVRRSISEWKGSLTLVTFIYTSCPLPTFCPLMDQNFATIQRAVADDTPLRGQVKLISISIDPAHDTPAVLAEHARTLKADPAVWTFLTGDQATTDRFAGRFGVSIVREDGAEGITHQLRTALIDRDGHIRKIYSGNEWTPGTVLADLRAALAGA
jgi:protein SCO1/2